MYVLYYCLSIPYVSIQGHEKTIRDAFAKNWDVRGPQSLAAKFPAWSSIRSAYGEHRRRNKPSLRHKYRFPRRYHQTYVGHMTGINERYAIPAFFGTYIVPYYLLYFFKIA